MLLRGGLVRRHRNMTRSQVSNDSVRAILMPNEIVIPVKYAKRVNRFLKQKHMKLPLKK